MFDSNNNANSSILPIFDNYLFNNFPSHLLDDDELFLDTILPYNPPPLPPPLSNTIDEASNIDQHIGENSGEKASSQTGIKKKNGRGGGSSRRRTGKKDRHSKIYTAQGPRDRRMRLSLQIARKFFDLQDMLGFDKASTTIEWLFNKSKAAIKELSEKSCNSIIPSSPSGEIIDDGGGENKDILSEKMSEMGGNNLEGMFGKNEKRKEARARARERTKEKLMMQGQGKGNTYMIKNDEIFKMEENPNHTTSNSMEYNVTRVDKINQQQPLLEDQMASVGIIEKFLATSSTIDDFGQDGGLSRAFSMDMGEFGEVSSIMEGTLIVNSEYSQVQGPNCAFMERTYNQGY